ncbi:MULTISPECIES: HNH endonuclease signature motif containing protein [unclassified Moorena]|uniref:HNH endonuclease n=1 Tax=unclassified Moorena TaxID=2683338 RepID=UPI0013BA314E|nr:MULTISPECIES: HNH endonuclease signature motif containing protein [unclassified Moorena]NEP36848.1 HNH endonuclease [Moorena sp. SIO3B2]NEQ11854.1 HNH endonuclease [Moorena sp. SIO4E2]NER90869.1 HNH endonuclease [Moorena sp. SIO3A2]NES43616.1 HNH endonuclease [Moorena sp. SIO2C4]
MPRQYITKELKRLVSQRAKGLCEYCLISEQDSGGCQFDHIISVKHGGETTAENLAYACLYCNLNKGTDLGSIIWPTGDLVRFFNPRREQWSEHFRLEGAMIQSLTDIGEVTARILQFNSSDRILERQLLIEVNRYPSPEALKQMKA